MTDFSAVNFIVEFLLIKRGNKPLNNKSVLKCEKNILSVCVHVSGKNVLSLAQSCKLIIPVNNVLYIIYV